MWPQYAVLYIIVLPDVAARGPRCCRLRDGAGRWRQEAAGWCPQWTLCPGQAEEVAAPPPPPQQGEVGPLKIWDSSRELIFWRPYFALVTANTGVSTSSAQYRVLDI